MQYLGNQLYIKIDNVELLSGVSTSVKLTELDEQKVITTGKSGTGIYLEYPSHLPSCLSLYTIDGQIRRKVKCISSEEVLTAKLQSGLYIYLVEMGGQTKTGKIVLK